MKKTVGGVIACVLLLAVFFFAGHLAEYILAEFVYQTHVYQEACNHCNPEAKLNAIPKHIHQIFFFETDPVLPERLAKAQKTWIDKNPGFNYTLWNKTTINELIDTKYPRLRALYDGYDHWVKRADVARYLVIHYYGGWYVDLDIHCLQSMDNLTTVAHQQNKSIVFRWTLPTGCSNDFIGVTPNHPFFGHVIHGLQNSNRWYIFPYASTMFTTGPLFLWGRFLNYPYKDEMLMIYNHSEFLGLMHESSWHSWDGKIVWYFYNHVTEFWTLLFIVLFLACALYTLFRYRVSRRSAKSKFSLK